MGVQQRGSLFQKGSRGSRGGHNGGPVEGFVIPEGVRVRTRLRSVPLLACSTWVSRSAIWVAKRILKAKTSSLVCMRGTVSTPRKNCSHLPTPTENVECKRRVSGVSSAPLSLLTKEDP
eukprot:2195485-Pyramimonas_sp.AAC.1